MTPYGTAAEQVAAMTALYQDMVVLRDWYAQLLPRLDAMTVAQRDSNLGACKDRHAQLAVRWRQLQRWQQELEWRDKSAARAALLSQLPQALEQAKVSKKDQQIGQTSFFDTMVATGAKPSVPPHEPWSVAEAIGYEVESLRGFTFGPHPLADLADSMRPYTHSTVKELAQAHKQQWEAERGSSGDEGYTEEVD